MTHHSFSKKIFVTTLVEDFSLISTCTACCVRKELITCSCINLNDLKVAQIVLSYIVIIEYFSNCQKHGVQSFRNGSGSSSIESPSP
jgi:hypothetical protein